LSPAGVSPENRCLFRAWNALMGICKPSARIIGIRAALRQALLQNGMHITIDKESGKRRITGRNRHTSS
jgi:hypothetical protein